MTSSYAQARQTDPDRALCCMFMDPAHRELTLALLLLNAELARIPEMVNEPMAGLIRFQWWHDAVLGERSGASVAEFAAPISKAVRHGVIDGGELQLLFEDRARPLEEWSGRDLDALIAYIEGTAGRLQAILARLTGADDAVQDCARHAGTGYGLIGILRATAYHARAGRQVLPHDIVQSAGGVTHIADAHADARLRAACEPIIQAAGERLVAARAHGRLERRQLGPLFLGRIARQQLRQLNAQLDSIAAAERIETPPWMPLQLALCYVFGRP